MARGYNPRNKKNNPRILSQDIYTFIAKNSSLNINQVKEVFSCYEMLIKEVAKNKNKTDEFTIPLPNVGLFSFKNCKGKKRGDIVKMPNPNEDYKTMMELVIEEDRPNFQRLQFKTGYVLQNIIKEATSYHE